MYKRVNQSIGLIPFYGIYQQKRKPFECNSVAVRMRVDIRASRERMGGRMVECAAYADAKCTGGGAMVKRDNALVCNELDAAQRQEICLVLSSELFAQKLRRRAAA